MSTAAGAFDEGGVDVVIVGSGVAGLSVAVRLADAGLAVGVVTKAELSGPTRTPPISTWPTRSLQGQASVTSRLCASSSKRGLVGSRS